MQRIDDRTMEKVELLAKLSLEEDERKHAMEEMEKLLTYMEELEAIDTTTTEALIHVLPKENVFREDRVTNGDGRESFMRNVPKSRDGQLVVPRTIQTQE